MEVPRLITDRAYSTYESMIEKEVASGEMPKHIAIIMDGNRRYAEEVLGAEPNEGHKLGRKKLDEVKARCDTYRRERDEARTLAARRLKRCRELEERNARLEADHERHKDSLVCLTDRLTALERENERLRTAIGHLYGECAEFVQQAAGTTTPTVVAQHNYYPGSLHVSGSHLPDARFNPAPTEHKLDPK